VPPDPQPKAIRRALLVALLWPIAPVLLVLAYIALPCRNILLTLDNEAPGAATVELFAVEGGNERPLWAMEITPGHHVFALERKLGEGHFRWKASGPALPADPALDTGYFSGMAGTNALGLHIAETGIGLQTPPRWTWNNILYGDGLGFPGMMLTSARCWLRWEA